MKKIIAWILKILIGVGFVLAGQFSLKEGFTAWQLMIIFIIGFALMDLWGYLKYEWK